MMEKLKSTLEKIREARKQELARISHTFSEQIAALPTEIAS
jgi:hypothetical protein